MIQVHQKLSYHCYVVAVKQDLVKLCHPATLRSGLELGDVLKDHVNKVIEAQESSNNLFVVLHDDVNAGADSFVHQL